MRYKFAFDLNKWEEHFDFIEVPANLDNKTGKPAH